MGRELSARLITFRPVRARLSSGSIGAVPVPGVFALASLAADRLVDALWANHPARTAKSQVMTAIPALRRLGEDVIVAQVQKLELGRRPGRSRPRSWPVRMTRRQRRYSLGQFHARRTLFATRFASSMIG